MDRVLVGLVLFCLVLPYLWLASHTGPHAAPATPSPSLSPAPYVLLNESRQPEPQEPADGDETLLNLRDFRWLQTGEVGGECAPLVLVLVHSAVQHAEHRMFIRNTWGSWARRDEVLVRFMVGTPPEPADQLELEDEGRAHGDVVQGLFTDSYRNLTYKHVMALKWFATRCPAARYVLKIDDDVLVNTAALLDFVRGSLSPHGARDLLLCCPERGAAAKRSYRSKWRVSYAEYPHRFYPTYCFGWSVMYSADVALRLYREAQRSDFFWIDDVLVTGVLPARLGLTHASWEPLVLTLEDLPRVLDGDLRPSFMLASHDILGMTFDTELRLWQRILEDRGSRSVEPTRL